MTAIKPGASTKRLTAISYAGRNLVIELHPGYLEMRQQGKRTRYSVGYATVFQLAAQLTADKARAEKKAARKKR